MSQVKKSSENEAELKRARAMARVVIEHHLGGAPKKMKYQTAGLTNFVFLVEHRAGHFVVRMSPEQHKIGTFRKEQWAAAKARQIGLPSVRILEVGNTVIPYAYMISTRLKGEEASSHPERTTILRAMGAYAAQLNAIQTEGFGNVFDWADADFPRHPTWSDFLHAEFQFVSRLESLLEHRMINDHQAKRINQVLEAAMREDRHPKLNHGDIRLKNVMVTRKGAITGVIDWEHCSSNAAPEWEFSIALHDLSTDEKLDFLQGYGMDLDCLVEMSPVIKALNVLHYAPYVCRAAERMDRAALADYRVRLTGALDLYSLPNR